MDYQVAMVVRVRCECVFLNRLRTAVFVSWHAEEYLAYANLTPNPRADDVCRDRLRRLG